jgi:orotidine-5'-phosphate decarboxylase
VTNPICAALDLPDPQSAAQLASKLKGHVGLFKIGLELFVAHGPRSVEAIRKFGLPIFLDLKLHDIPQTVEGAARGVAKLSVQYLTVHASGGTEMIRAAKRALPETRLLAVTVLTSLGEEEQREIGFPRDAVLRLARLAVAAGADGIVCAPTDVAALRAELGPSPLIVVPGIRPAGSAKADQRRTGTAREAVQAGASMVVVGRPLRDAPDPAAAADAIAAELR